VAIRDQESGDRNQIKPPQNRRHCEGRRPVAIQYVRKGAARPLDWYTSPCEAGKRASLSKDNAPLSEDNGCNPKWRKQTKHCRLPFPRPQYFGGEGAPAGAGEGAARRIVRVSKLPALVRRMERRPLLALPGHPPPPSVGGNGKRQCFGQCSVWKGFSSTLDCTLRIHQSRAVGMKRVE
jgi:hypothetical protein